MSTRNNLQRGSVDGWMIATVGCLVLFLIAGSLAIWAYMAYSEQKTTTDAQIKLAVAKAEKDQQEKDQKKFDEAFKNPRQEFVGSEAYGRVSFMYPKTWSVYLDKDGSDRGDYKAYFHPGVIPPVGSKDSRFAFRLEVLNQDFDKVLASYQAQLKKGDLTSSTLEYNGNAATQLDGAFSKYLRGSVVLMRVRNQTIRFSTDADVFKEDFKTVLSTVKHAE